MSIVIVMKFAIPSPHFPAILDPQGNSSLIHQIPIISEPKIAIVPNDSTTADFVHQMFTTFSPLEAS